MYHISYVKKDECVGHHSPRVGIVEESVRACQARPARRDDARHHFRAAAAARLETIERFVNLQGEAGRARQRSLAIGELQEALKLGPPPAEAADLQSELRAWQAR